MSLVRYPDLDAPEILNNLLTAGITPWAGTNVELHALGNLVTLAGRVVIEWRNPNLEATAIFRGLDEAFHPSSNTTLTLWCETSDSARGVHSLRAIWAMNGGALQLNHTPWKLADFRSIGFTVTTGRKPA